MSAAWQARAPGKLFVLGEYAVLDGGPAVVAAIDRCIEATLSWRVRPATVRIVGAAYGDIEFPSAEPPPLHGPLRFAIAAFRSAMRRLPALQRQGMHIEIASQFEPTVAKMGLGSSAAATVAVVAVMFAAGGHDLSQGTSRREVLAAALEAHRDAQQGAGSGADVVASVHGGLTLVEPGDQSAPRARRLELPSDFILRVAWSGAAADTPDLIARYRAASKGRLARRAAFVQASRACVDDFTAALRAGRPLLAAVDANGRLLEQLAKDLELPLLTPRLRQLLAIARYHGGAAKISGAGGGDCGLALARDVAAAQRICDGWRAAGIPSLDTSINQHGVTVAGA